MLRNTVCNVRRSRPLHIDGWVVLPDHMHCIWTLPFGNDDFSVRGRAIKAIFSRGLPLSERHSEIRVARGERGIWQRRFWKHAIRDDKDYSTHMDYLHFNPMKHGYVNRVADWPYSTFMHWVDKGVYPRGWGGGGEHLVNGGK